MFTRSPKTGKTHHETDLSRRSPATGQASQNSTGISLPTTAVGSDPFSAEQILYLQRTIGNQAVMRALVAQNPALISAKREPIVTQQPRATIQRGKQSAKQIAVMAEANKKAASLSKKVKKQLIKTIKAMGFTEADLDILRKAVSKAEMTVNINANRKVGDKTVAQLISEGGKIKNTFETGFSGGDSDQVGREAVEANLFPKYDRINKDSPMNQKEDRPKYAGLNVGGAAEGSTFSSTYGKSAFLLNEEVKKKATVTHTDSFGLENNRSLVGTFDHLDHVLLQRLRGSEGVEWATAVINQAKGNRDFVSGKHPLGNYMEVQIHADVELEDIIGIRASFNEAFGTPGGQALRDLASPARPIYWVRPSGEDQTIVEPLEGTISNIEVKAKAVFQGVWDEAKVLRARTDDGGKEKPLSSIELKTLWQKLLTAMPPANIFAGEPNKLDLQQLGLDEDAPPIDKYFEGDRDPVKAEANRTKVVETLFGENANVVAECDALLNTLNTNSV